MTAGLFGKLPSKRDFVAIEAPRRFLEPWEAWLQGVVASSRLLIGDSWQEAFLSAPIWRFWLGAGICGSPVLGALMPSVDGVGRYFPLCLFTLSENGRRYEDPDADSHEPWFEEAEPILLAALDFDTPFETTREAVAALPEPRAVPVAAPQNGAVVAAGHGTDFTSAMTEARGHLARRRNGNDCLFWTIGGDAFAPLALAADGLPAAADFAGMLTGDFGRAPREPAEAR